MQMIIEKTTTRSLDIAALYDMGKSMKGIRHHRFGDVLNEFTDIQVGSEKLRFS